MSKSKKTVELEALAKAFAAAEKLELSLLKRRDAFKSDSGGWKRTEGLHKAALVQADMASQELMDFVAGNY